MTYIQIPLEKLDAVRLRTRADLKDLEKRTSKRYSIRTFYLGPRKVFGSRRQGTTNKADAYAAKIAIYEVKRTSERFGRVWNYTELVTYV
jgi:hypothetical protein